MDCSLAEDVTYILWKREARVSSNKRQKEKPARWSCNVHLACSFPLQRTQLKEMKESVWMANLKRLLHFEGRESFQEIFCISSTLNSRARQQLLCKTLSVYDRLDSCRMELGIMWCFTQLIAALPRDETLKRSDTPIFIDYTCLHTKKELLQCLIIPTPVVS